MDPLYGYGAWRALAVKVRARDEGRNNRIVGETVAAVAVPRRPSPHGDADGAPCGCSAGGWGAVGQPRASSASEQRTTLLRRIAALDRRARIGSAWQRVIAERSEELKARLAEEISALTAAG